MNKLTEIPLMFFLLSFAVLISLSCVSAASTVYVNASGSDSNLGTIDSPFQTINKGMSSVDDNGTVKIANGNYTGVGNVNLTISKNMTILGQSQKGTIINGTGTNWVFHISSGFNVTIQNLTITKATTTDYGSAIANNGNLTVTNCTFTDNKATRGGAIYNTGTIADLSGCTFISNVATSDSNYGGGVIYNTGAIGSLSGCTFTHNNAKWAGGAILSYDGIITSLSDCTFTNNTAVIGGAIANQGSITVNGCTFIDNAVGTSYGGGAIYSQYSGISVHFSRFVNNTATKGKDIWGNDGSIDAKYNWWGSNNNPSSNVYGNVDCSKWLYMTITVNPTSIAYGGNGAVTVSFNNAYDGTTVTSLNPANGHIPDGTIVGFNSLLGTFNPATTTTTNGITTAIFTATSLGMGNINAITDSQTVSTSIKVNQAATTLIVNNVTGVNGKTVGLTATLKDENGNPVSDKTINFTVNGNSYTATTNTSGIATLSYLISETAGIYTIIASFAGDENYTLSSGTGNLNVNIISTTLIVNNMTGVNSQTVNLTATLKDENGNPVSGKTINFTVNGINYTAVTNSNGIATVNYKLTKAGVYTVNASFTDGTIYTNSTGNGTLTVNPSANLYINTTTNHQNPTVGETFTLTYKLGNYGPDNAKNVTITFQIPEGLEFINISVDNGKYVYNETTRTVIWTLDSVPVGDPYLYLTVLAAGEGTYKITPSITSETYNLNSGDFGIITFDVQPNSNNNPNNNENTVNAASKTTRTIGLKETGLPINYLIFAVLIVLNGLMVPKRK